MRYTLAPSMLSADFSKLGEEFRILEETGVRWIHVDVMDGMFVPNISFGPPVIRSIRKATPLFFDVHLMIEEPIRYVDVFRKAGADMITVHYEACSDLPATLRAVKESGAKCGLTIKPGTDAEAVRPYLPDVDMILVMSVEPGFGGQSYIPASTDKIRAIRAMIDESGREIDLEVDGGIGKDNVEMVMDAGVNVVVAGSAVFGPDIAERARVMQSLVEARNG